MNRMALSQTERRECVALPANHANSNRVLATELDGEESTIRRDRKFLATPVEDRPVKRLKKGRAVRELSPDKHLKGLLKAADRWVAEEHLQLRTVEYAVHEAGDSCT